MTKINNLVEQIFATAVALDQSGGLRNTIYAIGSEVFIMNYDHTALIRFRLRKSEAMFDIPISFKANDYDSRIFEQIDNTIIFHSENDGYSRKKICGTTDMSPKDVKQLFTNYVGIIPENSFTLTLHKNLLEMLDSNLSHTEFSAKKGEQLQIIQRNIYSGGIIEVTPKGSGGVFDTSSPITFGPLGIKTTDLQALFMFQDTLKFTFPSYDDDDFIVVDGIDINKRNMKVILAGCLYDEIIEIRNIKNKK